MLQQELRALYLEEMDITCWQPRFQLPGAALSDVIDDVEDVAEEKAKPKVVDHKNQRQKTSALVNANAGKLPTDHTPIKQKIGENTQQQSLAISQRPRFALRLFVDQSHHLWLVELGNAKADNFSQAESQLFRNKLQAIGSLLGQQRLKIKALGYFSWPMLELSHVDNSAKAAHDALKAYVNAREEQLSKPVAHCVVLGETLQNVLTLSETNSLFKHPCRLLFLPALSTLLKEPLLKKECWQAYQQIFADH